MKTLSEDNAFTRKTLVCLLPTLCGLLLIIAVPLGAQENQEQGDDAANEEPVAQEATDEEMAADPALVEEGVAGEEEIDPEALKGVTPLERLGQGGVTMLFIGLLSVAGLTFFLERLFHLKKSAVFPDGLTDKAKELWKKRDYDGILRLCDQNPSALGHVITYLVRHRTCHTLELSAIAGDIAGREMRQHLQKAYPLAIVATIAPLLGLFGTVLGMIESFEIVAIAGSLGDASLLAGGISKALVTTAGGLALAMPALGAYHYFRSRTNQFSMGLEGEVNDLLTTWFMEKAGTTAAEPHREKELVNS